jgi:carboxyl-terminal processing protease
MMLGANVKMHHPTNSAFTQTHLAVKASMMKKPRLRFRPLLLVSALALLPIASATLASSDTQMDKNFAPFWLAWEKIHSYYVDTDKVDDKKLVDGAIEGMLKSLDAHSAYHSGQDYDDLHTLFNGSFGGLGLSVAMDYGFVKVIAPLDDTPASRAGIKAGDIITHINGKYVQGQTLTEATKQMRGTPGTKCTLTILRAGKPKPFDVTLTRETISVQTAKWEVKGQVGYIRLTQFDGGAGEKVHHAMDEIHKKLGHEPIGYILDLRSNGGGLLNEAVAVADDFMDGGEVVSQKGHMLSDDQHLYSKHGDPSHHLPLIVLVDVGTASASEIVAGALQDHHRALIMGVRSFGKGSVQTEMPVGENKSITLTTARYYTPSGRSIQEKGIEPDIVVPQLSDADIEVKKKFEQREEDLKRHLLNQSKVDDKLIEADAKPDPHFALTAEQVKAKGITDYQLWYALETLNRIAKPATSSATPTKPAAHAPVRHRHKA